MKTPLDSRLGQLVAEELDRSLPEAAREITNLIRERHGDSVAAVLFYGSCLRKQTLEGVLDLYVLVDNYRTAYPGVVLPAVNAVIPPNVFYVEHQTEHETIRAKYAVLSCPDFEYMVSPRCRQPYIWARFAQPFLLAYRRDAESAEWVRTCAAEAIVTLVRRLAVFLPVKGRIQRYSMTALWQEAFARTYSSELRTESPEAVRAIYEADPERYDEAGRAALEILVEREWIDSASFRGGSVEVAMPRWRRASARWRWSLERPLAKSLAFARLLKNSTTFGEWLPYVLWKLQRHTGVEVALSDRQRRHPLIFAWPVLFRLLWQRSLR